MNGDTPLVACDHYHLYEADFDLLQTLGVSHYRLSVAWPGVFPAGDGVINSCGLDFYSRLIDDLLDGRITPWVTLFHWDLPQSLEDLGGWLVRPTVNAFGGYADAVVKKLGDRVKHWFTVNEIPCFIGNGYGNGYFGPVGRSAASNKPSISSRLARTRTFYRIRAVPRRSWLDRRAGAQSPASAAHPGHRDCRRHHGRREWSMSEQTGN